MYYTIRLNLCNIWPTWRIYTKFWFYKFRVYNKTTFVKNTMPPQWIVDGSITLYIFLGSSKLKFLRFKSTKNLLGLRPLIVFIGFIVLNIS